MEYFDLVNENDEVIGVTTKEQSHANGELHRIVAVFVFDPSGRLYMQEHIKSGGKYDHSVGGHVTQGESYDTAAKREAYEELNITSPLQHVSTFYSKELLFDTKSIHVFSIYETTLPDNWEFIPNEEVTTIIPLPIDEIVQMMNRDPMKFTKGFLRTMKEYIKVKNLPYIITL
jgi:isopentenyldiphosphate isomerase